MPSSKYRPILDAEHILGAETEQCPSLSCTNRPAPENKPLAFSAFLSGVTGSSLVLTNNIGF
jgi:hypothetical protein